MKRLIITIITIWFLLPAAGAEKLVEADAKQTAALTAEINQAASKMTSMECSFVQTKRLKMLNDKLTSRGEMRYRSNGSCLRWEYTSPYTYTFVMNGTKVMLDSGKKKNVIDVKTNRMFEEIARIMMNSVTGQCLTDKTEFSVKLYTEGKNAVVADLTPLKKQMKQMFVKIRLHFDRTAKTVNRVEMYEKGGDFTVIELLDIKKNRQIDDKYFKIG